MVETPFYLKIKIGEVEVEIGGEREEVLETLQDLDRIVELVGDAFNVVIEDKKLKNKNRPDPTQFPKIPRTNQCSEAVTSLLLTDWGKTPRTIGELRKAMEANAVFFPKTTLSGVLVWLTKRGDLRRWKDPKRGYLYVINELEE
jgi:hypothetical protein